MSSDASGIVSGVRKTPGSFVGDRNPLPSPASADAQVRWLSDVPPAGALERSCQSNKASGAQSGATAKRRALLPRGACVLASPVDTDAS
jgi:hypothetical protein